MANLIRKVTTEITGFVWSRLTAPRKKLSVPVTICLEPEKNTSAKTVYLKGHTKDLSKSGVAVFVPAIRIGEKYLVGENRTIYAQMDLPNGRVRLELTGCRYEQHLGIHDSIATYLIGARILHISESDSELYDEYLKYGDDLKRVKEPDLAVKVSES
jgi:hypothetical protein